MSSSSCFIDIGLACNLAGVKDEAHLFNGPMAGHLFENFCIQETIKFFLGRGESRDQSRPCLGGENPW